MLWVCVGQKANSQIFTTCGAVTRHLLVQGALHVDLRCLRNTENSWLVWWTCWSPFPVLILSCYTAWWGLPVWRGKEPTCQCRRHRFDPWVRKIPWRRKWQPTPVFLPGQFRGQRSLTGYSPWGHRQTDTTEHTCMLTAWSIPTLLSLGKEETQCASTPLCPRQVCISATVLQFQWDSQPKCRSWSFPIA